MAIHCLSSNPHKCNHDMVRIWSNDMQRTHIPGQFKSNNIFGMSVNGLITGLGCTLIEKFMGPTWGPTGSCRPQVGPMLVPWTLLSRYFYVNTSTPDQYYSRPIRSILRLRSPYVENMKQGCSCLVWKWFSPTCDDSVQSNGTQMNYILFVFLSKSNQQLRGEFNREFW